MAACSFGVSGFKISSLNFTSTGTNLATLLPVHGLSTANKKFVQFNGLIFSLRLNKALIGCRCSTSEAIVVSKSDDSTEDTKSSRTVSKLIPNLLEVESLVTDICDTTSIAEFELKLGGFRLYVKRNLTQENMTLPAPVSVPVTDSTAVDLPTTNGSASSTSFTIYKSKHGPVDIQTLLDKAADDGLVILQSPKVGYFWRSRNIKGKRAFPCCKECNISGEVIKILRADGEPVGFSDML